MDIKLKSDDFLNKFKSILFDNFFKFDNDKKYRFINFLKEHNIYIGGKYLTYILYDIEYTTNISPKLYISRKNAEKFILNIFPGFVIIETGILIYNDFIDYDNTTQVITLSFINGNGSVDEIDCYIYDDIYTFLKYSNYIPLFEIWWNPIEDKINVNNIHKFEKYKLIDGKIEENILKYKKIKKYDDIDNIEEICDLFALKGVTIKQSKKHLKPILSLNYKDVEKEIIMDTLKAITYPMMDVYDRQRELRVIHKYDENMKYFLLSLNLIYIDDNNYLSEYINNELFKPINDYLLNSINNRDYNEIFEYNAAYFTSIYYSENLNILCDNILKCILLNKIQEFTFKEFIKVINYIYKPHIKSIKIRLLFDKIITKFFLNNININFSYKNKKIKFTKDDGLPITNNIKHILSFYYYNKIYNNSLKYKYKFIDLVINKFNLFNINFNIHTNTDMDIYYMILLNIPKTGNLLVDPRKTYIREYHDIINSEKIEDVNEFIEEDNENILIVAPGYKNITCISKNNLDKLISDYNNNWYYDCMKTEPNSLDFTDENYLLEPYIKLDLNIAYYVPYKELYSLLKSPNKVFYIHNQDIKIKNTRSYKSTRAANRENRGNELSIVGAWHCQEGTSITISYISTLKIDLVEKMKISLDKSYTISSSKLSSL